jgi:hypothetical protein
MNTHAISCTPRPTTASAPPSCAPPPQAAPSATKDHDHTIHGKPTTSDPASRPHRYDPHTAVATEHEPTLEHVQPTPSRNLVSLRRNVAPRFFEHDDPHGSRPVHFAVSPAAGCVVYRYPMKFGGAWTGPAGGAPGFGGAFFGVGAAFFVGGGARLGVGGRVVGSVAGSVVGLVVGVVVGLVVGVVVVVEGGGLPAIVCARATVEICGATQTAALAPRPALMAAFANARRSRPPARSPLFLPRPGTLRSLSFSTLFAKFSNPAQSEVAFTSRTA